MNYIQRKIQLLNRHIGFNVNSIQGKIEPLNPQIGFNVNYIQRNIHQWLNLSLNGIHIESYMRV